MESLLVSTLIVSIAEIGDKTQLLSLVLAARFKRPVTICFGILAATLLNHALAGAVGALVTTVLRPDVVRWVLGVSFLAMAVWILIPDKLDDESPNAERFGVFLTTFIAFFITEMGDKTQIATVMLAARYAETVMVVVGTTLGMMIANVPAVYLGERVARRLSLKLLHAIAAVVFAVLGVMALFTTGNLL